MAETTKKTEPKTKAKGSGVELPPEGENTVVPDPRITELEAKLAEQEEKLRSTEEANQALLEDLKKKDGDGPVSVSGPLFRPEVGSKSFRVIPKGQNAAEAGLKSTIISGVPDESEAIRQFCEKNRIKSSSYVFQVVPA